MPTDSNTSIASPWTTSVVAKKRSQSVLSHRKLIGVESILVVGLLQSVGQDWLHRQSDIPWWFKTLLAMAMTAGLFGAMVLIMVGITSWGLRGTHSVISGRLLLPLFIVHSIVFLVLFYVYARQLGYSPW